MQIISTPIVIQIIFVFCGKPLVNKESFISSLFFYELKKYGFRMVGIFFMTAKSFSKTVNGNFMFRF